MTAIDNVNVRWGLYYQDLVAPLPTVRPTIFCAFVRQPSSLLPDLPLLLLDCLDQQRRRGLQPRGTAPLKPTPSLSAAHPVIRNSCMKLFQKNSMEEGARDTQSSLQSRVRRRLEQSDTQN